MFGTFFTAVPVLTKSEHSYVFFCRPEEFIECEPPVDHNGNMSAREDLGHGCLKVSPGDYLVTCGLTIHRESVQGHTRIWISADNDVCG